MKNKIYNVCKEISKNENVEAIMVVGSSKNLFHNEEILISDVDLFVFVNVGENQIREITSINNISFDINFFPINKLNQFLEEIFFLKEMNDPYVIYDKNKTSNNLISLCKQKLKEGPKELSFSEKNLLKANLEAKIFDLKNKEKFEEFEYKFLVYATLKEILISYLKINKKWVLNDKKLIKSIENVEVLELIKNLNYENSYFNLKKIYKKLF